MVEYAELVYILVHAGSVGRVFYAAAALGEAAGGPGLHGTVGEDSTAYWPSEQGWEFATRIYQAGA